MNETKPTVLKARLFTLEDVSAMAESARAGEQPERAYYNATVSFLRDIRERRGDTVECIVCSDEFGPEHDPAYLCIAIDPTEEIPSGAISGGVCGACCQTHSNGEILSKWEELIADPSAMQDFGRGVDE